MNEAQAASLRKPFPPEVIGKIPKGGVKLDYVGHAGVTDRLLQVDPEWTWEPLATTPEGLPMLDHAGNLWIRLTVCGVTRLGVGDGPDAKQCISDAIRNAAMRFGVALDLWSKEDLQPSGGEVASAEEPTLPPGSTSEETHPGGRPSSDSPDLPGSSSSVGTEPSGGVNTSGEGREAGRTAGTPQPPDGSSSEGGRDPAANEADTPTAPSSENVVGGESGYGEGSVNPPAAPLESLWADLHTCYGTTAKILGHVNHVCGTKYKTSEANAVAGSHLQQTLDAAKGDAA